MVDNAKCIVVTRVCVSVYLSVCLSAAVRPHYCTDPDVTWGVVEAAPSCALLVGFAIGAPVALLWQHNANPSLRGVRALLISDRRVTEAFSTLLRRPGLRASNGGVLPT